MAKRFNTLVELALDLETEVAIAASRRTVEVAVHDSLVARELRRPGSNLLLLSSVARRYPGGHGHEGGTA